MNGTYLLATLIVLAFIFFPEDTQIILTTTSLKIQVYWINWRMKRAARKLHRQLSIEMKKNFGHEVPPFKWVDIWDRDSLD